jgi:hypothetical protein
VPNFAAGCSIQAIDPFRRFFMQEAEHLREIVSPLLRRVSNEVVVV